MNIEKKELGKNSISITIQIVKADYEPIVELKLNDYRKKASMPGFRPGKTPKSLIKKMYGNSVLAESIDKLLVDNLYNYINDNDIKVLGQPVPATDQKQIDFENPGDFDFTFEAAISPKIEIELNKDIKIDQYEIEIDQEMIDNQIATYTGRYGDYKKVEEVAEKDMVKGLLQELENGNVKEGGIEVKDAVLTPAYMKDKDAEAKFIGAKLGDAIIFNPKTAYENIPEISSMLRISKEDAENITADFQMTIEEVTRYQNAEIGQPLFDKAFGEGKVNSEEEFMAKISESLNENLKQDSRYKFLLDTKKYFIDKFSNLEFADDIIKRWLLTANKDLTTEKLDEQYSEIIKDITWQLILETISQKEDIKIEDEDIIDFAKKIAKSQFAQYGMVGLGDEIYENYAKEMLKDEKQIENIIVRAKEDKIIDLINKKITLNSIKTTLADFNKLFETKTQEIEETDK